MLCAKIVIALKSSIKESALTTAVKTVVILLAVFANLAIIVRSPQILYQNLVLTNSAQTVPLMLAHSAAKYITSFTRFLNAIIHSAHFVKKPHTALYASQLIFHKKIISSLKMKLPQL